MEKKTSFIIPAYNAEKYIGQCVASILNQTCGNYEVIIINDGSNDRTLSMLREFEKKDHRICVIDQKNEGVSGARNNGIDAATGDYIVFVDADDYLAPDYLEYMLSLAEKTGADVCISQNCFTRKNEPQAASDEIITLGPGDAVALLLSPRVIVGCWNKIYRTEFVKSHNLRFSTSLFYGEGLLFITNAAQAACCVGVGNRKVYYYRRNNEDSATATFSIEKMRNGEQALRAIRNNIRIDSPKIDSMWRLHISLFSLGAMTRMKTHHLDREHKMDYWHWHQLIAKNLGALLPDREISIYRKMMLLGGLLCPGVVAGLDTVRRKKIRQNSVE